MAIVRDLMIVLVLCVLTGWLPTRFLEFRGTVVGDQHGGTMNQSAPVGLIFATDTRTLNFVDTVIDNGKTTARPGTMIIQNGLYPRAGYSMPLAIFGGVIMPLLTAIGAAHFVARSRRKLRNFAGDSRGKVMRRN
jgi:hypothetical protein